MPVQLGAKPLAGFDRPIEMLIDCHRRIEHFLDVLARVIEHYAGRAIDAEGRQALAAARAYFEHSAPKHAADEELSLFPRMRSAGLTEAVDGELEQLQQDHHRAAALHARINRLLDEWSGSGHPLPIQSLARLRSDLADLRRLYEGHIRREEQHVFPAAARGLDEQHIREIGAEMRARRGLP